MQVSPDTFKRIILNDRYVGYKPNREFIKRLRILFPDIVIGGFGKETPYTWYVIASSSKFPVNGMFSVTTVYVADVIRWAQPKLVTPVLPTV